MSIDANLWRNTLPSTHRKRGMSKAFLLTFLAISSATIGCSDAPDPIELGKKNFIAQIVMPIYGSIRIHECDDLTKTQDGKELLTCKFLLHGGYVNWTEYQCETIEGGTCSPSVTSNPSPIAQAENAPAPMPANAEPDQYATQGWSCKIYFTQVGKECEKQSIEIVKKIKAEKKERDVRLAMENKLDAAKRKKEGVQIGMSQEDVRRSSWGRPNSIHRTTTSNGTHEQWVYDGNYLYFENGQLTTIQN